MKTILLKSLFPSSNSLADDQIPFPWEDEAHTSFELDKISVLNFGDVKYYHPDVTGIGEYYAKLKFGKRVFHLEYYNWDGIVLGGAWPKFRDSEFFTLSKKGKHEVRYALIRTIATTTEKYQLDFNHVTGLVQVKYIKSSNGGNTWTIVYWGSGQF